MNHSDSLTIIVPVYNEEDCLEEFHREMILFLDSSSNANTILFVNDGSLDASQKIIEEICARDQRFKFIILDKNYGLSTAIKAGIDACETTLLGYIDADLQTKPSGFNDFLEFFPEHDMVNGIRAKRRDSYIKKLSSKFANSFRRIMINDKILDTCCPLKVIKTEQAKKMPFFDGMHRFMPALIQIMGGKVKQVPVDHFPRYAGVAKYHLFNRLISPFFDTLAFVWMRNRYIKYRIKHQRS